MRDYFPTRHAAKAMAERSITWAEILEIIEKPEVTYESNTGKNAGKDSTIHQRGSLYVVVANSPTFSFHDSAKQYPLYAVITCGLRTTLVWNNEDARQRAIVHEEDG